MVLDWISLWSNSKVFDARTQNGERRNLSSAPNGYSRQQTTFLPFWLVAWTLWYRPLTPWDFENSESLLKTVRSLVFLTSHYFYTLTFHMNAYGSMTAVFTNIPWTWVVSVLMLLTVDLEAFVPPCFQLRLLKFSLSVKPAQRSLSQEGLPKSHRRNFFLSFVLPTPPRHPPFSTPSSFWDLAQFSTDM